MSNTRKERDINVVINGLMMITKKYGKNTTDVIWSFKDLRSSIVFMAPEYLETNEHWYRLIELIMNLFPITKENQNDPFIQDLRSVFSGESTEEFEMYQETDEEKVALREYADPRILLWSQQLNMY